MLLVLPYCLYLCTTEINSVCTISFLPDSCRECTHHHLTCQKTPPSQSTQEATTHITNSNDRKGKLILFFTFARLENWRKKKNEMDPFFNHFNFMYKLLISQLYTFITCIYKLQGNLLGIL